MPFFRNDLNQLCTTSHRSRLLLALVLQCFLFSSFSLAAHTRKSGKRWWWWSTKSDPNGNDFSLLLAHCTAVMQCTEATAPHAPRRASGALLPHPPRCCYPTTQYIIQPRRGGDCTAATLQSNRPTSQSVSHQSAAVSQACRSKIFPAASLVAYTILGDDGGHSVRVIGNFWLHQFLNWFTFSRYCKLQRLVKEP